MEEEMYFTGFYAVMCCFIPRSKIKKEDGIVTALVIDAFQKEDEYTLIEDLDFGTIEW